MTEAFTDMLYSRARKIKQFRSPKSRIYRFSRARQQIPKIMEIFAVINFRSYCITTKIKNTKYFQRRIIYDSTYGSSLSISDAALVSAAFLRSC